MKWFGKLHYSPTQVTANCIFSVNKFFQHLCPFLKKNFKLFTWSHYNANPCISYQCCPNAQTLKSHSSGSPLSVTNMTNNNNNNNTNDNIYGAVIVAQSHCESSPGSRDEYGTKCLAVRMTNVGCHFNPENKVFLTRLQQYCKYLKKHYYGHRPTHFLKPRWCAISRQSGW